MKKLLGTTLSLVLMLGLISNPAQAQVDYGIRGGLNFSNLNDTDLNTESQTGFMAGVYMNYQIANSPISIQPEVLYTQKGATLEGSNGSTSVDLSYIEIPVLAKVDYVLDGSVMPHVYFGPYIGFNVNAEGNVASINQNIEDQVKTVDFGVVVGAGVDINRFNVGARYTVGLTPVFDNNNLDAKNGVISIVAGYSF